MIGNYELMNLFVDKDDLTNSQKTLLVLSMNPDQPKKPKDVREALVSLGILKATDWNVSQLLGQQTKYAINLPDGWLLSSSGREYVREFINENSSSRKIRAEKKLREIAKQISDDNTKKYVEEAILCLEVGALRAAIVLVWEGAVAMLHTYTHKNHLPDFNAEGRRRRSQKWKEIRTTDDFGLIQESDFLDILTAISVLQRGIKNKLKTVLDDRNNCGHPNSYKIGDAQVAAHIEFLIENVFIVF